MEQSLAEIVTEFERQRVSDPTTADRSLLEVGRLLFEEHRQESTLQPEVMHAGRSLLFRLGDYSGIVDLLSRYLTQPLSVDEEAWARWHLTDNLAICRRHKEAVTQQQDFFKWAQEVFPTQRSSLSRDIPFDPIREGEGETLSEDSLFLWVMGDGAQAGCWYEVGKGDEWVQIFHDIMSHTKATPENRFRRFNYLRTAALVLSWLGRTDEALQIAKGLGALAEEESSWEEVYRWKVQGYIAEMRVHQEVRNTGEVRRIGIEAMALIDDYERQLSPMNASQKSQLRSSHHGTGGNLYRAGQYDLAIPLLRRVIEFGTPLPWAYLWLAASLWSITKNRAEVLALLKQAAYRNRGNTLWDECCKLPEFQDVVDDPEFQRAATLAVEGICKGYKDHGN